MESCQIDLVVFEKEPSKDENENICKYVVSCLDVFSPHIFFLKIEIKGHN